MENTNEILNLIEDPKALEDLYRSDEKRFKDMFVKAYESYPDALILNVWNERLREHDVNRFHFLDRSFLMMTWIGIASALTLRFLFFWVEEQIIAPINLVFALFPFMSLYLMLSQTLSKRVMQFILSLFFALIVFSNLIPMDGSDKILLTYLHLPIVLWLLWGLSHTGDRYREVNARIAFLKFNGEFLVLYILFALAGVALTGITLMLFGLLGVDIGEFYFENIVIMGVAGLAIVASHVVQRYGKLTQSIAPLLAKVFSPLVLITLLTYLIAMLVLGKNPFLDRDFLISFNVILVLVLAITIYLITERGLNQKPQFMDSLNLVLVACALLINAVALIAMAFRLTSFGITPNRLTSLVINVLIMIHLLKIGFACFGFIRSKKDMVSIQSAVTSWFPVYGIWALIVILTFPFIF